MNYTNIRKFILITNRARLKPIEKDVLLYYISKTSNDEGAWHCPDTETAEAIFRSRNGVCAARLELVKQGWIFEGEQFDISINHQKFSVSFQTEDENSVSFQTQNDDSVSNETQNGAMQSEMRLKTPNFSLISDSSSLISDSKPEISVSFQTPYKDKGNIKEFKGKEEKNIYISPNSENSLVDETHQQLVDETLHWIRQKKNMKKIPQSEWVTLFIRLEEEEITLDQFKDFYQWVENLDWVTGIVSIPLLQSQIEAYKNREHLEAKNIIKRKTGGAKNNDGNRTDGQGQSNDGRNSQQVRNRLRARKPA